LRKVLFEGQAFEEYSDWAVENASTFKRLRRIICDAQRNPFQGLGKPEPLKHDLKGCWSRHITDEHRLVYTVSEDVLYIISCKSHYK
jgi:toxin YoeB